MKRNTNDYFYVEDFMRICSCGKRRAYQVLKALNEEMASEGYYTFPGRISRKWASKKLCLEDK